MNKQDFADNLRAELARQNKTPRELYKFLPELCATRGDQPWSVIVLNIMYCFGRPPSDDEIKLIADALGCPVERLTVTREDLEGQVRRLRLRVKNLEMKLNERKY